MDDTAIQRAVLDALEADERLSSRTLRVEATAETVVLTGRVQSSRCKLAAQEVAEAAAPGRSVVNRLVVEVPERRSDEALAEDVRELLAAAPEVSEMGIVVEVHAGRVALSGSVRDLAERRVVADVALQAPGAREVVNQLVVEPAALGEATVVGRELEFALKEADELAGCALHVTLSGDVAVLSGTAQDRDQVEHALALVREVWVGELRDEVRVGD